MKRILLLLLIRVLLPYTLLAQEPKLIKVKAGEDIKAAVPMADKYRYLQFKEGVVHFFTGATVPAKLNYSQLLGEMHFISPSGDTLSLANESLIKDVTIGETQFYYDSKNGFLEVVADHQSIKLAVKQMFRVAGLEKLGGYQQSSGVSSIKNYSILATGNSSVKTLEAKGDVVLSKEKSYFFIDQNNRYYKVNKSNLLKIYVKHKKALETYIKEGGIDFDKEESLRKILAFCSQLP
ncbi:MAG: hypothetical protein U0X91_21915 [Spirosomataceae bacterium]